MAVLLRERGQLARRSLAKMGPARPRNLVEVGALPMGRSEESCGALCGYMKRHLGWLALLPWLLALVNAQEPVTGVNPRQPTGMPAFTPGNNNLKKLNLPPNPRVMIIPVNDQESTRYGMIDPWQVKFVTRRLEEAAVRKYDLVIIEINTGGGLVASCDRINRAIADCPVPVIAHVRGTAFSGGAIISMGCRAIVMEPGSNIGGAQAVGLMSDLQKDQREKARSLLVAMVKALSEKHGYPGAIVQGMVDMSITIYETDDPSNRFLTDAQLDDWKDNEVTRGKAPNVIATWKDPDTILTLTSQQAYDCGLASALPQNRDVLFTTMGVTPSEVYENNISGAERVARFLGHPIFMILLIVVAIVAVIYELKAGGHFIGWFIALLCVVFFFWLAFLGDSAGWLELGLFLLGLILFGVELFVFPGFGVAGIAGVGFILLSVLSAFIPAGALPTLFQGGSSENPFQAKLLTEGLTYAAVTMCTVLGLLLTALWLGVKLPGVGFLSLKSDVGATVVPGSAIAAAVPPPAASADEAEGDDESPLAGLVGQEGQAETVLRPSGKVRVAGVTYDAHSEGGWIEPGSRIRVLEARTSELIVRAVKKA